MIDKRIILSNKIYLLVLTKEIKNYPPDSHPSDCASSYFLLLLTALQFQRSRMSHLAHSPFLCRCTAASAKSLGTVVDSLQVLDLKFYIKFLTNLFLFLLPFILIAYSWESSYLLFQFLFCAALAPLSLGIYSGSWILRALSDGNLTGLMSVKPVKSVTRIAKRMMNHMATVHRVSVCLGMVDVLLS